MKWNYKFKGKRISQWLKLAVANYKNTRFMVYVPLKTIVREIIPNPDTKFFEEFITENLIETFINEGWSREDKQTLIYFLREFIKRNFNNEKEVEQ
jgi:hypothetical protein